MKSFELSDTFIKKYKALDPGFGFNGLGEITFYRTYSRQKEDGVNEQWYEVVRRVVEGSFSMQKNHITEYNLGWDEEKAQLQAQEMYDRIFKMKFLPSGRSLWVMGTDAIYSKGLYAALNACSFVSTKDLAKELTKPFEYMMDMSMLGCGVGFDVKGAGQLLIRKPKGDFQYKIPDTREGWVESLKFLLEAYFIGSSLPIFDYSLLRKKGELIKTFGGKSSGPEPLIKLHKQIIDNFSKRIGDKITATDITDVMNQIGCCVVAGNVRRSAQIALGTPTDEYLKLKDYTWDTDSMSYKGSNSKRAEWGWTSNNTVFSEIGDDYTELAEQVSVNGEPGFFWINNTHNYARMNGVIDTTDNRAEGTNPCGEQPLESYEMCCLVETFPTRHDNLEDFLKTLKYAYLFAKTVTLGKSHWAETNRVQMRNRRIGTSISGIAQFIGVHGIEELRKWLEAGYSTIKKYDQIYSDWLCVPRSIRVTSIKPSGTVSLLAGVTPGVHFPESTYYIRRIRFSINSSLLKSIKSANYPVVKDLDDPDNTVIVEIPVEVQNCKTIDDTNIWEQLAITSFLQKYWADNQVSSTVTFKPWEKDQIKTALDYYQYQLKLISFLPKADTKIYPQMPYEKITKKEYEEKISTIKQSLLKFDKITDKAEPELYCTNDTCVIK
jgi:adenosylcobalamin-dependent ribonucleoside-triphosphate reductase